MTSHQPHSRSRQGYRQNLTPVLVGLCLILLALLSVAQVGHLHSNPTDADHCQLCIVMHTLVPVAQLATAIIMVQLGASAPKVEPTLTACQFLSPIFIRPPPASC
ncbi:exported hypothetical protein [Candidatus Sulfotelmatomonas gaucii]|uniref:Uncharacterized protein n=1 Tax=Candidatus Sulfuritelmatomonas gaucii TaxID=2043161 RepID=A0A2N9LA84_9BACT|nr:exported hypothetical protein [Candidatus Sulfotelmatomonas gaucii]